MGELKFQVKNIHEEAQKEQIIQVARKVENLIRN